MIQEIIISDMESLLKELNTLPNNFIYRGHADSTWALESTLERVLGGNLSKDNIVKFENRALETFKSKFHIYKSEEHTPSTKLAWLSLMQHYGVPTKLIDFTESPFVALYFALEAYNPTSQNDLAIYALDYSAIMEVARKHVSEKDSSFKKNRFDIAANSDTTYDEVVDRFSYEMLWVTEPLELNARIDRQAGTFLLSGNSEASVEELLQSDEYSDCLAYKFIIKREMHLHVFCLLRKMNISAKTIYGDLSGLAKAIRMELQAYAN